MNQMERGKTENGMHLTRWRAAMVCLLQAVSVSGPSREFVCFIAA
jgi:hypothetical protein